MFEMRDLYATPSIRAEFNNSRLLADQFFEQYLSLLEAFPEIIKARARQIKNKLQDPTQSLLLMSLLSSANEADGAKLRGIIDEDYHWQIEFELADAKRPSAALTQRMEELFPKADIISYRTRYNENEQATARLIEKNGSEFHKIPGLVSISHFFHDDFVAKISNGLIVTIEAKAEDLAAWQAAHAEEISVLLDGAAFEAKPPFKLGMAKNRELDLF